MLPNQIQQAFRNRIAHIAVGEGLNEGVDPFAASRLELLGIVTAEPHRPVEQGILDGLRQLTNSISIDEKIGPLYFFRGQTSIDVVDVHILLLHEAKEVRVAALEYLMVSRKNGFEWLSSHSKKVLQKNSALVRENEKAYWLKAGIEIGKAIEDDLLSNIHALGQCQKMGHLSRVNEFLEKVLRPTFNQLRLLRPPVWDPESQQEEIQGWISEFAETLDFRNALDDYVFRIGYLPMNQRFGASALVQKWSEYHSSSGPSWDDLWSWATQSRNPVAKFHAIEVYVSMHQGRELPSAAWNFLFSGVSSQRFDDDKPLSDEVDFDYRWVLFIALAHHYALHIDSIHPGQKGDAVASYAWWLASKTVEVFNDLHKAKTVLDQIVEPEVEFSLQRWQIARSPSIRSDFRFGTTRTRSVWTISFIMSIVSGSYDVLVLESSKCQKGIDEVVLGLLVNGWLTTSVPIENTVLVTLRRQLDRSLLERLKSKTSHLIHPIIDAFSKLWGVTDDETPPSLESLVEYDQSVQGAFALMLLTDTSSSESRDKELRKWLSDGKSVAELFRQCPLGILKRLTSALVEFHLYSGPELSVRIPHILAYVVEKVPIDSKDEERVNVLLNTIFTMCVNTELFSPIQRVWESKWNLTVKVGLENFRESLTFLSEFSDEWVSARVRAMQAGISRIIGPHSVVKELVDAVEAEKV